MFWNNVLLFIEFVFSAICYRIIIHATTMMSREKQKKSFLCW